MNFNMDYQDIKFEKIYGEFVCLFTVEKSAVNLSHMFCCMGNFSKVFYSKFTVNSYKNLENISVGF